MFLFFFSKVKSVISSVTGQKHIKKHYIAHLILKTSKTKKDHLNLKKGKNYQHFVLKRKLFFLIKYQKLVIFVGQKSKKKSSCFLSVFTWNHPFKRT